MVTRPLSRGCAPTPPPVRVPPRRRLAVLLTVLLPALGAGPARGDTEQVLESGPTRVIVRPWEQGVSIIHHGLLVSRGSSMVVTTPPWTPHYYLGPQPAAVAQAERRTRDDGLELVMHHRGQHDAFLGEDVVRLYHDGRVERELRGRFTKDEGEALIQWRIAGLTPELLVGRPYEAELADGTRRQGTVPISPVPGSAEEAALARGFRWIEFQTRIGPLRIECDGARPLICYDFRGGRWADPTRPLFWFGDLGTRFSKDQPLHYRVTFHLPRVEPLATRRPLIQGAALPAPVADAQHIDLAVPPVIIPRPREAQWTDRPLRLPATAGGVRLHVAAPEAVAAEAVLRQALAEALRRAPDAATDPADAQVRFETADPDLPDEGYELRVDDTAAVVRARDAAGFLHGVQTLRQLCVPQADGALLVRGVTMRDWPALPFRGVHLFTGGRGNDLHLRLLRRVLAPLKFNQLVLECEYIKWDCCPEIHHPEYGMPKDEVREILAAARALGIETTPLVQSLGHCQWMFHNDQNLDLAEDPEARWAYCVTNPDTYVFIQRVYAEALELFQPRAFHIGHDEFTDRGRVPYRESSQPYTPNELFIMDTLRHHEWFSARGVQLMMWGDMILGPDEGPDACNAESVAVARQLRGQLPKDIIITDWHYADVPPERFVNLGVLHEAGFATIASTWYRPGNIVNFAQAAHLQKSRGLLQTTWAGYSLDAGSFARELHQYAAYVLAAEAAWNADRPIAPDELLHGEHFQRLWGTHALPPAERAGWLADLRSICNEPVAAADADGWFGLGPQHDLSAVPRGTARLGDVLFRIGDPAGAAPPGAVVLCSRLVPDPRYPRRVELHVGAHANRLVFLHATNFGCAPDAVVARYEVLREDGGRAEITLRYGQNIFAYNDLTTAAAAPIIWTGRTAAGTPVALRALVWENPFPDQLIRAVFATSSEAAGSLVWVGLTGLRDGTMTE
jgi:hexosaminidase